MIRRVIFVLAIILLSVSTTAQKVIQMENVNGVYRIACNVNGAKMKMIFDTGASKVSLSESMASFLYDNGYISKEDVIGTSKSQTADGSIHNNIVINLKDIEISGIHIKNVQAVVLSSQNAPLLLGQSAIQKLGQISLNGNKLIIFDFEGDYNRNDINRMLTLSHQYYNDGQYQSVIDILLKIIDYNIFTTSEYFDLIWSFFETQQFENCIKYGKEWEKNCRNETPTTVSASIMMAIGTALSFIGDDREAVAYLEKSARIDEKLGFCVGGTYCNIGVSYNNLGNYEMAINSFKKALKSYFVEYKTSENQINQKGLNNTDIGVCLYAYALTLYDIDDISSGNYLMKLSAKCNFEEAIKYCYKNNIKFKSNQSLFE